MAWGTAEASWLVSWPPPPLPIHLPRYGQQVLLKLPLSLILTFLLHKPFSGFS